MQDKNKIIFPEHLKTISREEKEGKLKQQSKVIWMTGLSGSGKTTLARQLDRELFNRGYLSQILDGDIIRSGINNNLGFTEVERKENIRRIAEVSKLFLNCGVIAINSFISPTEEIRRMAMDILGRENVIEVYVNAPLEVCEGRDVKGMYAKARRGEIKDFTGIDSPYEPPLDLDVEVKTDIQTVEESAEQLLNYILPRIDFKKR